MITGPASYPPTVEDFLDHWQDVNDLLTALPAPDNQPLVLRKNATGTPADVTHAALNTLLTALNAQRGKVAEAINNIETSRADIELRKAALLVRLNQFNAAVRTELANTKYPAALSHVPSQGDGPENWRNVCDDVVALWAKIEYDDALGATIDLKLLGNYTYANFVTEQDELRQAFRERRRSEKDATTERAERNRQQEVIYGVLKAYRGAVPVKLGADAPLSQSLPRLTPEGSRTPDPVAAQAVWDAPASKAKVTYEASTDEDLKEYQVRACPGPDYEIEDEEILAHKGPAELREFLSNYSLALPGQTCGFRVMVVLNTGNEAGSEPVFVTRPA